MIKTFEELFEKMKAKEMKWIPFYTQYENYLYWAVETERTSGSIKSTAHSIRNKHAEYIIGYLACLHDIGYIDEYEQGQLVGLLNTI